MDGGYSYVWIGENLVTNTGSSIQANPTMDGTYTVQTTESCPGEAIINVEVMTTPMPTVDSPFPICEGESGLISGVGSSLTWYDDAQNWVWFGPDFNPLSIAGLVTTGIPTTIYVSQTVDGCISELLPIVVEVLADVPPDASTVASSTALCSSDVVGLDLMTLVIGNPAGTWTTSAPLGTIVDNVFIPSGIGSGNYSITYTVPGMGNCSSASTEQSLLVIEPTVGFTSDVQTICNGESVSFNNLSPVCQ